MVCPKCGFDNPQPFAFCGRCGSPITVMRPAPQPQHDEPLRAERRQLTVMFCDLVGSTTLSGQLDPEELHEVTGEYHSVCVEIIENHGGRVAQFLGDGLLVYFGYPYSHEDDAQRAVRAGLEIVAAFVPERRRLSMTLEVRIAIHTGLAVVGQLGGGADPNPMAIAGETPNIAARLQTIAEPGQVVISAATYRLIQGFFVCRSLGTPALKGVVVPMEVFKVVEPTGIHTRFERVVVSGLTPFVGREREIEELLGRWQQTRDGQGQVVLLTGEAGIGKSRLVQVLRERTANERLWEIGCRCSPYYQNSAFYPVIDFLERNLGFDRNDGPQDKLTKLERALAEFDFELQEVLPLFAALLSLPQHERYPALPITPQRQKQNTLEALVEWLMRCAQRAPVRLVMEDLHWADPSTLELIELLLERTSKAGLLLILIFRPEFAPPWRSHITNINLGRLSNSATELMIRSVAGGKQLPAELTGEIVKKTEGVPLFVEELTQTVLESGVLYEDEGGYSLIGTLPSLAIPSTLYDSLMARLDRLGTAKEVAQLGAIIGREFSYELVSAIAPMEGDRLTGDLSQLVDAELLTRHVFASQAAYSFRHALIRDAAYESLLRSKRRQYHAQIATVIRERFPEIAESQPELLASHYTDAGMAELAISMWHKAGQRALQRSANQEAIHHLTNGLDLLSLLPETADRRRQELHLRVTLGPATMAAKGFASIEAQNVYAQARKLSQEVGEGPLPFQVSWALWVSHACRAEHNEALGMAEECLRLAQLVSDPDLLIAARHAIGAEMLCLGRFAEGLQHFERGLELYDTAHHGRIISLCGQDSGVVCLAYQGFALWFLGYPDQARQRIREASALARKLAHPLTTATIANLAARVFPFLRDPEGAWQEAELAISLSDEHKFEYWRAMGVLAQGWALSERGMLDDAITQLRDGLTSYRSCGAKIILPCYTARLADALRKAGRMHEAIGWLKDAQAAIEETRETWWEPEVLRIKAEVIAAAGGPSREVEAEASFQRALAISRAQGARSPELRAATGLGRLLLSQGRKSEARRTVSAVYNWFTEGFDTPDLREAKTLVDELQLTS